MGAEPSPNDCVSNERISATSPTPPSTKTAQDGITATTTMNDAAGARALGGLTVSSGQDGNAVINFKVNTESGNERCPPLPPRPVVITPTVERPSPTSPSWHGPAKRPQLQANPTIAVSSVDIQTLSFPDGSRGTFSTTSNQYDPTTTFRSSTSGQGSRKASHYGSEVDDTTSLMSYAPTFRAAADLESLLGGYLKTQSPAWKLLNRQADSLGPFETAELQQDDRLSNFEREFDEIPEVDTQGGNEEQCLFEWKSKFKHYLILSSAGKPIYSRHGDQNLINGYIGIVQTIISFYEGAKDPLKGFTAGDARFVITTEGPLYLVAISKLGESDSQLRAQLEALYMQILSTLTLPTLIQLFSNRPSTDLRRPLQGTEPLLSSLADTFTKGSPSALLSALECLKTRKSQRQVINNTLLKTRTPNLLYGLIVAGGRLVSVVRPKRHSLHPSDLQLIFNMLFEAGGVKAGGGENWIPLCLPGFNNTGYLYMYVSFLSAYGDGPTDGGRPSTSGSASKDDEVAILLISADKESFYELKKMRDNVVVQLEKNGSMDVIKKAIRDGRPSTTDLDPGTQLRHFLYKSRANVQFTMPSFSPHFNSLIGRRRLLSLYHNLHASAHARHSHLKVLHCLNRDSTSLAWVTPLFEFYCIAGPNTTRASLAQGANKIIQWVEREEERVFIIGGAVF